jgi:two-component system sensor histidine kinase UhpB
VSLRLRLNLLVAMLNLGFLVALGGLLLSEHRKSIEEETEAAHRVAVQLLGTAVQTSRLLGGGAVEMAAFLQSLGRVRGNEIRFQTADGRIAYVSPPSSYKVGRAAPEWFARLMQPRLEATVIGLPGARLEILPEPSRSILDAWDSLLPVAGLGLGFVLVLHGLLWFLLRHLLQPTEADARRLVATTRELADQRAVSRLVHERVEAERKRVARELHDELGQSLTAIRLIATSLGRGEPEAQAQGIAKISEIAAGLYDSVHRIVRELRPAVLEQPDLAAAVDDLAREWRARHPQLALETELQGDLGDLGETTTLALFRAVQEALTNVLKHASATRVALRLVRDEAEVRLDVIDDGRGAGSPVAGSRHGLAGMRERIVALGGAVDAGPAAEGGFRVSITVPLSGANP